MAEVKTQVTPVIVRPEDIPPEGESFSCELQWEINNKEDNDNNSNYYLGSTYFARLYKGADINTVNTFSTNGTLSSSGSGTASKTEQISFTGGETSSLSFPYSSGFSSKIIGKAYDTNGNRVSPSFTPPDNKEETVVASTKCFCILEVTYQVSYTKYSFSSRFGGESILVAVSTCGGDLSNDTVSITFEEEYSSSSSQRSRSSVSISSGVSTSSGVSGPGGPGGLSGSTSVASWYSSSSSVSSSESTEEEEKKEVPVPPQTTSVTLVYKDFVTGIAIEGVSVSVDGSVKGTTDASGQVIVHGITTDTTHTLKASKEGYLTTDSDSLANDSFIINT